MRIAIPLAAILLVGIAAGLHRAGDGRFTPDPSPTRKAEASPDAVRPPRLEAPAAVVPVRVDAGPKAGPAEAKIAARKDSGPSWSKVLSAIDRDLALSQVQRAGVEEILRDREVEIAACHDAIRKAGFVDLRHYDWQVDLMKAAWYRRLDALFDRAQHERFLALLAQGLLNEGLSFTVEPGLTVLD